MRTAGFAAFVAVAAVLLGGCIRAPEKSDAPPSTEPSAAATATSDAQLKEALLAKIKADPELSKEPVEVEVKDGQITLTGTVSTGAVRIRLEDLARSMSEGQMVNAERLMSKE